MLHVEPVRKKCCMMLLHSCLMTGLIWNTSTCYTPLVEHSRSSPAISRCGLTRVLYASVCSLIPPLLINWGVKCSPLGFLFAITASREQGKPGSCSVGTWHITVEERVQLVNQTIEHYYMVSHTDIAVTCDIACCYRKVRSQLWVSKRRLRFSGKSGRVWDFQTRAMLCSSLENGATDSQSSSQNLPCTVLILNTACALMSTVHWAHTTGKI